MQRNRQNGSIPEDICDLRAKYVSAVLNFFCLLSLSAACKSSCRVSAILKADADHYTIAQSWKVAMWVWSHAVLDPSICCTSWNESHNKIIFRNCSIEEGSTKCLSRFAAETRGSTLWSVCSPSPWVSYIMLSFEIWHSQFLYPHTTSPACHICDRLLFLRLTIICGTQYKVKKPTALGKKVQRECRNEGQGVKQEREMERERTMNKKEKKRLFYRQNMTLEKL